MIITSIVLDDLELVGGNYHFFLSGLPDFEKDIVTNDLFSDGVAWGRSKNKPKTLVLDGYILSGGVAAEWALNKVLAPNGLKTLIVNNTYKCKVEVVSRGSNANNSHIISCQLTMPDPYWCAQTAKSVQLGSTSNTALVLPAVLPWTLGSLTGGAGTITNDGNADAYPVITVVGTCSNISVTNQTTGENVGVSAALSDNDELVIDCRPATCGVYLNGVADIGLKTSPGWMRCVPGDNQIVFSRNSLQNKKHCTVVLNERWI
jgi:hypothetical protein